MGAFEVFDLVGFDVSKAVMDGIYHQYYEEPRYRPSFVGDAAHKCRASSAARPGEGFLRLSGRRERHDGRPNAAAPAMSICDAAATLLGEPAAKPDAGAALREALEATAVPLEIETAATPSADAVAIFLTPFGTGLYRPPL